MDLLESSFSYNSEDFEAPLIPIPTSKNLTTSASFNSLSSYLDEVCFYIILNFVCCYFVE